MKSANNAPVVKQQTTIVVDPDDRRSATVRHGGKVIFTIKVDVTGVNPAIVVVATQTHLKTMQKGMTGIILWNGTAGLSRPAPSHNGGARRSFALGKNDR